MDLARVFMTTGGADDSEERFQTAITTCERLLKDHANVPSLWASLAESYDGRGMVSGSRADIEKATKYFETAIEVNQREVSQTNMDAEYENWVAYVHNSLGKLYRNDDKPADAVEQYQFAIAITERLVAEDKSVLNRKSLGRLAKSCNGLGLVYRDMRDLDEAVRQFQRAIEIGERLAEEVPKTLLFKTELAGSRANLAGILIMNHDFTKSLNVLAKAQAEIKSVLETDPDSLCPE